MIESNYQLLRALIAWLGLSQQHAATELEISLDILRDILNGVTTPNPELRERIARLAARWPHGNIEPDKWPGPKVAWNKHTAKV